MTETDDAARAVSDAGPAASTPAAVAATPALPSCGNCGAELRGPHCYRCGQPTQGLVRHFSSVVGDFFDSVFNLDSRTLQTIGPLFLRPGFLSCEYFAGRRVRYVTPVRMFVFLTLIAFFVSNLAVDIDDDGESDSDSVITIGAGPEGGNARTKRDDDDLRKATTVAGANAARDRMLGKIKAARAESGSVPGVAIGLDAAEDEIRETTASRITWIRARDAAIAAGKPVPKEPRAARGGVQFGDWDPHKTPVALPWLPDFANTALTGWGRRAYDNGERIRDNPRLLVEAFFSVAPQTLFVLLPLFAVLLKIFFVFKRRLYMEHMIVALHSHAFIALWLILMVGVNALTEAASFEWLTTVANFLIAALWIWLPLYLLLMQKRVYQQGWIMTLLKFGLLGLAYVILLSLGATVALMLSLVNM